ncbi:aminotransferase class I/II-fold pyridoxal phosphate-dependent enzyme [Salibacterium salarium]|uniref:Aminotransferase class I/II-fold pyridoxal phosphate-dependent enzyme n=1 Tax=Salibacterium salarium TaxID=284579 RepID=A0A428MRW2_9BACI|nr:aminotransferase class I/II-fold pyridoxal phosphate-dependent enzyme [Salibacterium salarium]RSL28905.1 aminotransferase class I/II-fold pyridoxal phosphate-dependent enzyme [Salibacterium salarium]
MNQNVLPIVEALQQHNDKQPVSFHVPGHKSGWAMPEHGQKLFSSLLAYDQTELTGLDDLHEADDVIALAQELAADVYDCAQTLFLVGGSTAGNIAMIVAAFQREDVVFVQRDVHKSIINGLRLAGVTPVFLYPAYDEGSHLSLGLSVQTVEEAFRLYPSAQGLILTSPSYYGWTPVLRPLIEAVHERDAVVLVDEAHGAHFPASSIFPASALTQGADLVVQSAHKTLPALTMTGYLHIGKSSRIPAQAVQDAASMVQSSSPSYPLLASLDIARKYLFDLMQTMDDKITHHLYEQKSNILKAAGLQEAVVPDGVEQDPLKCIVQAPEGYSGWILQQYLEEKNIFPELADHRHVLFILSFETVPARTYEGIEQAVKQMRKEASPSYDSTPPLSPPYFGIQPVDDKWNAKSGGKPMQQVVEDTFGKKTASDIIPYPPGIPLFLKGETLTGERFEFLCQWLSKGGAIQGGVKDRNGNWYISIWKKDGKT